MTDRELEEFIKFGEEYIRPTALLVGTNWSIKAIQIAKELRDRLAQPEREWVGLTDEEIAEIPFLELVEGIQAKLKEKNT